MDVGLSLNFKRHSGLWMGGPTKWMDKKFPVCPLCKKTSLWEYGSSPQSAIPPRIARFHFRCPKCGGVLSISLYVVRRSAGLLSLFTPENAIIENVGTNSALQHLVGREYPIKELQEWIKRKP